MSNPLLDHLKQKSNARGLVLVRADSLCQELRYAEGDLTVALVRLENTGEIEVLTPPPFLVLKLKKWPGSKPTLAKTTAKHAGSVARAECYSFKCFKQSKLLNESYSYSKPTDEGALLKELLQTLGESDATTFRGALQSYSPEIIRAVLERVRKTKNVRTNRAALFRYLLPRIAKDVPKTN